jgi:[acyl-carrier-protein] S-malonyltransferase
MLEALAGPQPGTVGQFQGEHLFATERIVVSPGVGLFTPADGLEPGTLIDAGQIMGKVGALDVRSAFAGYVMGFLAVLGERVTASQPIAWLRTA